MTAMHRLLLALATASLLFGCSKAQQTTTGATSTAASPAEAPSSASAQSAGSGDAAHGKALFTANCSQCHGDHGTEGGVGPSLRGEKARKDLDATIAWIKNPQAPMPKLYPAPLSEKDVADVAAFVQTL